MASEEILNDCPPLLENESCHSVRETEENPGRENGIKCRLEGRCCYLLELCFAMYLISGDVSLPVSQFYVYNKIAESYGISNYIRDDDGADACSKNNSEIINNIQKDASQQLMYMTFLHSFTAVIPTLFLGNISDKYGRKISFLITISGLLLNQIVYNIVLILDAPLPYLYIGNAIEGLTGYRSSAQTVAFAMLADFTSPGKERSFRITLIEGVIAMSAAIAIMGGGFLIKHSGFLIPMLSSTGLCLVTIVIWVLFVPETKPLSIVYEQKSFRVHRVLQCFVFYYEKSRENRRGKMTTLLVILLLVITALLSKYNVTVLFLLNQPFCWTELHITIVTSVQILVNWPVGILLLRLLQRVMSDAGLLVWGCFFGVVSMLPLALANADWMVYLYAAASSLAVIVVPTARSFLSKLTSPEQQGALFAGTGALQHLIVGCGGILFGRVYKQSVDIFPGLTFFISCGLMFCGLILSGCLYKWMSQKRYIQVTDN